GGCRRVGPRPPPRRPRARARHARRRPPRPSPARGPRRSGRRGRAAGRRAGAPPPGRGARAPPPRRSSAPRRPPGWWARHASWRRSRSARPVRPGCRRRPPWQRRAASVAGAGIRGGSASRRQSREARQLLGGSADAPVRSSVVNLSPSSVLAHARSVEGRKQLRYAGVSVIFVPLGQVLIQLLGATVYTDVTPTGKETNWVAASITSAAILTVPNFFANKYWVWKNTSR